MKLEALNTLVAVLRHGSFAAASEFVHLTPSAVSVQVRQLEEYFGQPLFDRSGRQVRPTAFAALRVAAPSLALHFTRGSTVSLLQALKAGRIVALGDARLSREIALVCRGADAEDRRQLAVRDAFMVARQQRGEATDMLTRA